MRLDGWFFGFGFWVSVMIKVKSKREIDRKTVGPMREKSQKSKILNENHPGEYNIYYFRMKFIEL